MIDLVDFHAHILPGADHGSARSSVSLEQLKMAMNCGVSKIIATPHFYPQKENADSFLARRSYSYQRLRSKLTEPHPEIILGAEVLICDNIEEMPMLSDLCIAGTNVLLLELPFTDFSKAYVSSVAILIEQGYNIVLAHADRYNPKNIDQLIAVGAKIQLNAEALSGFKIQSHILKWIAADVVYAIGSDIHGADKKAYKSFKKTIKKLKNEAEVIMQRSNELLTSCKK